MGGRKRKAPKRAGDPQTKFNAQVWSDEERLNLLAYLDWCVQNDVDFHSTVIHHLKEVTQKEFTSRQIRDKLQREWTKYGNCDRFEDIFSLGTSALNPEEEEDTKISRITRNLDPFRLPYRLRSTSSMLNTRSRSRSTRGGTTEPTTRQQSGSSLIHHSSRRAQKGHQVINPQRLGDQSATTSVIRGAASIDGEDAEMSLEDSVKGEDESDLSSILSLDMPDLELSALVNVTANSSENSPPSPTTKDLSANLAKLRALEKDLLTQKGYVFMLRNRLSETQRELGEMHHRSRAAKPEQYHLQQQISNLKQQLEAKDRLWLRTRKLETSDPIPDKTAITQGYGLLYHSIDDGCSYICDNGPNETLDCLQDDLHQSAQTWSIKVSGWNLERLLAHSRTEAVPKHKLFSSLVAAAIFELVLKPVFPEVLALECPLLNQYRKHICAKDGSKALHQLDIISLESLASEDYFETEVIPRKVEELAEFIWQTLEPLLFPKTPLGVESTLPDRQDFPGNMHLVSVLSQAVDLKLKLTVSAKGFKFKFVKPGERFDTSYMRQDDGRFAGSSMEQHRRYKYEMSGVKTKSKAQVILCLYPALYTVSADNGGDNSVLHIGTTYDKCITEAGLEDIEPLSLISPAVVLLSQE